MRCVAPYAIYVSVIPTARLRTSCATFSDVGALGGGTKSRFWEGAAVVAVGLGGFVGCGGLVGVGVSRMGGGDVLLDSARMFDRLWGGGGLAGMMSWDWGGLC